MESFEPLQPHKSKRNVLVVSVVIILITVTAVVSVVIFAAMNNTEQEAAPVNGSATRQAQEAVATEAEVTQELSALDKNMKELKTDRDAAKASSTDNKQTKVGS